MRFRQQNMSASGLLICLLCFFLSFETPLAACDDPAGKGVDWQDCRKRNLDIRSSELENAKLERVDLTSTDLRQANLSHAVLHKAILVRASLSGSTAKNADFTKALGYRTTFSSADYSGSKFSNAEISRSDFSSANLQDASFEKADLARSIFSNAILTGSSFNSANLARADLRDIRFDGGLDFTRAFLMQTRIEGLDLSRAGGLAQWQVDMACGDDSTVLPEGLSRPTGWPCKSLDED